jgi:hypothetical protein
MYNHSLGLYTSPALARKACLRHLIDYDGGFFLFREYYPDRFYKEESSPIRARAPGWVGRLFSETIGAGEGAWREDDDDEYKYMPPLKPLIIGKQKLEWKDVIRIIRSDVWLPSTDDYNEIMRTVKYRDPACEYLAKFYIEPLTPQRMVPKSVSDGFAGGITAI